jgi:small GTP-binding protein domain
MKKVILVGNPNVGKSLLFSRMTGKKTITANYGGTTVGIDTGRFRFHDEEYELVDGPGIYSLEEFSEADEMTLKIIDEGDILINILDATNLERNLSLTLQLVMKCKPMVVCLNFWEDTKHKGIKIDKSTLEKLLGIPVIPISALRNEGINELLEAVSRAQSSKTVCNTEDRWNRIGDIIAKVQKLEHRHHTFLERLDDFSLHPIGGIITAIIVLFTVLAIVRFLGEGLTNQVLDPLFTKFYDPFMIKLSHGVPSELIKRLLFGTTTDPMESFGILTSGVYIAIVLVFPYFFSFYLVFGFLEDFGYLPRLAVVLDRIFHKLGLHGYSSIPVMLGLGCKVPAIMSTRVLNNKREKILTISLILMSTPCLPQSSMIISLGMHYGIPTVLSVFIILLVLAFLMNTAINKVIKGEIPELFTELPSYQIPSLKLTMRKLWIRIMDYFKEVLPMIAVGVLIINILDALKVLSFITNLIKEPLKILLGLPPEIAPIMLLGFLRKDVSIAMLAPLNIDAYHFIIASIFLVIYTPCISSLFSLVRETGLVSALKIIGIIFATAILAAAILHGIFRLVGVA